MRFTRLPLLLFSVIAFVVTGLISPVTASAAPYCGITWGSLAKGSLPVTPVSNAYLVNVRAGQQTCYDRLVVDIAGPTQFHSWRVQYVSQVRHDPTDRLVPLRGGAFLQITVGASDHRNGTLTYAPANRRELVNVTGYRTFRQVAWAGSFEGLTTVGLGVRARLPFRVFALTGIPGSASGTRVVIDVAHYW